MNAKFYHYHAGKLFACICLLLLPLVAAQAQKVSPASQQVTANQTQAGLSYIYFKITNESPLVLTDYKKGISALPAQIKGLSRFGSIHTIHRPYAVLKTDFLLRVYRIAFEGKEDETQIISELKKLPFIEFAVPDMPMQHYTVPSDLYYDKQWALHKINMEGAWNISTGNANIKIAVVDDAFRLDQEDLAPVLWTNPGEIPGNSTDDDGNGYIDDVNGWDAAHADNDPSRPTGLGPDDLAHGTACASIAVAHTNNFEGMSSPAYNCTFIPVKIGDDVTFSLTNVWDGVAYAVAADADVVSMSWGGFGDPSHPAVISYVSIGQAILNAGHAQGVVFVAAVGNINNTGIPSGWLNYPSVMNHVIAVGSTAPDDVKSQYSNYGTPVGIDIMAPGEHIYCAAAASTDGYAYFSGTSMSCPLVAGVCALIKANNPSLTAAQIETCLLNGARDIDDVNPNHAGQLGAGRLDAFFAVSCATNNTAEFAIQNSQQACLGTSVTFEAVLNNAAYRYYWNFGDGNVANNQTINTVSHTYTVSGIYTVSLSIKNTSGVELFQLTKKDYVMATSCSSITGENTNWYFGYFAGLDFSSGRPVRHFNNFNNSYAGSACISNSSTGNIEFYGGTGSSYSVRDNTHSVINTSPGFLSYFSSFSSNSGGLIIKKPGTSTTYSIFPTTDPLTADGFRYYDAVSGAANSSLSPTYIPGPGSSVHINGGVAISSPITAIEDCGSGNYWIITKSQNNAPGVAEMLYVHKYTSSGITYIGSHALPLDMYFELSNVEASPDGSLLALSYFGVNSELVTLIFKFNRTTGAISDFHALPYAGAALTFSPNSDLLYLSYADGAMNIIGQFDMLAADPAASLKIVTHNTNFNVTGLQLGPDDKIYINYNNKQHLGAIYFPDQKITVASPNACGYAPLGVWLVNNTAQSFWSGYGLPNDVDATEFPMDFTYTIDNCNQVTFTTSVCAPSYSWTFGDATGSSLQNPTHTYGSASTFTVQLTANSTSVSKFVTIPTAHTAAINFANDRCDRTYGIVLRATPNGGNYIYTWYKNGVEIPDYANTNHEYLAADAGIYSVKVTNPLTGCESTSGTYTYTPATPLTITMVNPGTFTGANNVDLTIDPASFPTYPTYTWYRDGEEIYTGCACPTITVNKAGTYRVYGYDGCGNELSAEFRLKIDPNCSPLNNVGPSTLYDVINTGNWPVSVPPAPTFAGTIINGTVTIPSGINIMLTNTNLIMNACSEIIIQPGGSLYLDGVNITGCSSWKGITVDGASVNNNNYGSANPANGQLEMYNCYLSDAEVGVFATNGGYFYINNTEFDNNGHHVVVNTLSSPYYGTLNANRFKRIAPGSCGHSYVSPHGMYSSSIIIDNAFDVAITYNTFARDVLEPAATLSTTPLSPSFASRDLYLYNTMHTDISYNQFYKENAVGIYALNALMLDISNNFFQGFVPGSGYFHQMTGIYTDNCTNYDLQNNEFQHCYTGIEHYGLAGTSIIDHNKFEQNIYGAIIAPETNPLNNTSGLFNTSMSMLNVVLHCNKFWANRSGVVGSGYLQPQGSMWQDASNDFVGNMEWNMLWQWPYTSPFPTVDYYFGPYTDPNLFTGPAYNLNGVSQSATDMITIGLMGGYSTCWGTWKKDPTTSVDEPVKEGAVKAYPNPFSNTITVDFAKIPVNEEVTIKITDIQGKAMFEKTYQSTGALMDIDMSRLAAGVYFLTANWQGETHHVKLVKTAH